MTTKDIKPTNPDAEAEKTEGEVEGDAAGRTTERKSNRRHIR